MSKSPSHFLSRYKGSIEVVDVSVGDLVRDDDGNAGVVLSLLRIANGEMFVHANSVIKVDR